MTKRTETETYLNLTEQYISANETLHLIVAFLIQKQNGLNVEQVEAEEPRPRGPARKSLFMDAAPAAMIRRRRQLIQAVL
ncbi:hypothetical protein [Lacipirellula limnantheis]|uniref:Uncharacterized protein n=1 Tax=Lacipirellula limnantheis TaxID=2528024 RepID=A0A517U1F5_9BACT|nr:hypothetical protein [Lacipirellula limnantheis]QDT74458.1 hypothetical protein I41_36540 [Lacipirellula limnantheis]